MDPVTIAIADHAAGLDYGSIPAPVVHAAKQRLIDTIACAIGGSRCEAAAMGRRIAKGAVPRRLPGRILGTPERATAEEAAFVNGAMIRYLDFNDTVHGGHPSDALGAVLALADAAEADGKRLLTGMIVAYETATRLIAAARLRERGWDQGFAIGIAAAAGAGHMLRLPAERLAHAVAITTVANVPLRATRAGELSKWKGAATAFACRNAVYAAQLAAEGMTGPEAAFTGRHGAFEQLGGAFELQPFGGEFLTPRVGLKYWPVENSAQAAVWAAMELRRVMPVASIADIDIAASWAAWHELGSEPAKWAPKTRETADHSLAYIFARGLVDGEITVRSFDAAQYLDPALRPLMAKIRVHQDAEIDQVYPARVLMRAKATDAAGRAESIEIANPRGHVANPMTDAETEAKFMHLAEPELGKAKSAAVLDMLWHIERESSLGRLYDLLEFDGGL
ncbi:MAG TPA: MmgE/PrpD family protein [Stellaceae bacterium]|nr:MmgE/PrpD family protein [Stellaceae bacterium]